jgi:hypothetical protein
MTDDQNLTDDTAPEQPEAIEAEAAGGDENATGGETTDAPLAESATGEDGEQPAVVEAKPREVIKGIHPELRCSDPVCAPEYTELQFFSPEEVNKQKGKIMLFCAHSGLKYFAPAAELQAWIAENKIVKTGRGRKDG